MSTGKEWFLRDYFELCDRYGLYVQNNYCCCGSSSVAALPSEPKVDEYDYEWERYISQRNDLLKAQSK